MIVIEFIIDFFLQIIFEGIICGFFRLIKRGYNLFKHEILGIEKPVQPQNIIFQLEKKLLYKKIKLTETLNHILVKGLTGAVLEIIDENKGDVKFKEILEEAKTVFDNKEIELNDLKTELSELRSGLKKLEVRVNEIKPKEPEIDKEKLDNMGYWLYGDYNR